MDPLQQQLCFGSARTDRAADGVLRAPVVRPFAGDAELAKRRRRQCEQDQRHHGGVRQRAAASTWAGEISLLLPLKGDAGRAGNSCMLREGFVHMVRNQS